MSSVVNLVSSLEKLSESKVALHNIMVPRGQAIEDVDEYVTSAKEYITTSLANIKQVIDANGHITDAVVVLPSSRPQLPITNGLLRVGQSEPRYVAHQKVAISDQATAKEVDGKLAFYKDTVFVNNFATYITAVEDAVAHLKSLQASDQRRIDKNDTETRSLIATMTSTTYRHIGVIRTALQALGYGIEEEQPPPTAPAPTPPS
jgi:hypothetical protein